MNSRVFWLAVVPICAIAVGCNESNTLQVEKSWSELVENGTFESSFVNEIERVSGARVPDSWTFLVKAKLGQISWYECHLGLSEATISGRSTFYSRNDTVFDFDRASFTPTVSSGAISLSDNKNRFFVLKSKGFISIVCTNDDKKVLWRQCVEVWEDDFELSSLAPGYVEAGLTNRSVSLFGGDCNNLFCYVFDRETGEISFKFVVRDQNSDVATPPR